MNRPMPNLQRDTDLGPLDAHGEQIWSPEEAAAIDRLHADPQYRADIAEGLADIAAGRCHTSEDLAEHSVERKRRWLAERGL